MLPVAHIDFETRSATDLKPAGVYRYAEDPNTGVWVLCWRIGNYGIINRWRPGDQDPVPLLNHIAQGGIVVAHNAAFERTIWNSKTPSHWPRLQIAQQDCTMARAAAVSRPQSLDLLCRVLNTHTKKDMAGSALMMKMARPRKVNLDGTLLWWAEDDNQERLANYCDTDVETESEVEAVVPPLTANEREVWMLDQVINDRGIPIDTVSVQRCAELVEHAKKDADRNMRSITGHVVPRCSNGPKLVEWIRSRGIDTDTVRKDAHDDILASARMLADPLVEAAITLRSSSNKSSVAKYGKMMDCVCIDNRIRGLLAYHAAGPGRWAGRLVQPQNFPRNDFKKNGEAILRLHSLLHDRSLSIPFVYNLIETLYGEASVLKILSLALRSMFLAPAGKKFVGGDLSNIEGRGNAWVADEHWKLDAFRAYDAGTGPDLYRLTYANSFGVPLDSVDDLLRQIGKVMELALGYQGSVNAFITMGANYGLDPADLVNPVRGSTGVERWENAAARYEKAKDKYELPQDQWTALKILVANWRAKHPCIVQSWWDYQDAAVEAVSAPGIAMACAGGKVSYYSDRQNLWCVLPSGRMLCYASPSVETEEVEYEKEDGSIAVRLRNKVAFWGMGDTNKWEKKYLYGGLQCENIVQATARDIMVGIMHRAESAGYAIVLTVHDELLTEVNDSQIFNKDSFEEMMTVVPEWATGLPLAASTWEDKRYVK